LVLETTVALVIVFSVLVVFHEFGHFAAARATGIAVEVFALGFGPKLVRLFRSGGTDFEIHLVPFGGFVKLRGMEPDETEMPDGFQAAARWKRALTIFAGPLGSFLLAVLISVTVGVFWGFPHDWKQLNRIAQVFPQTPAYSAGLRAGDRILSIDGEVVADGDAVKDIVNRSAGKRLTILIDRQGSRMQIEAAPEVSQVGFLGTSWMFEAGKPPAVAAIESPKGSVAASAGIRKGDRILSVNGMKIETGKGFVDELNSVGTGPCKLVIESGDNTRETLVTPRIQYVRLAGAMFFFPGRMLEGFRHPDSSTGIDKMRMGDVLTSINGVRIRSGEDMVSAVQDAGQGPLEVLAQRGERVVRTTLRLSQSDIASMESSFYYGAGVLGFIPEPLLVRAGFLDSVIQGLHRSWISIRIIIAALSPDRIGENVGGPVMIVKHTRSVVALGPYYVAQMAGMLSLSLAIINLFPIPVLDGGHLLMILVEAIRRKRLTQVQMQAVMMTGLVIIGILFVMIMWSDLFKISQGLAPR